MKFGMWAYTVDLLFDAKFAQIGKGGLARKPPKCENFVEIILAVFHSADATLETDPDEI